MYEPRPKQKQVLAYRRGRMGVSAVPGSGKTHTLSMLAAQLISSGAVEDDQEVLIVTLVNSAVDNFTSRIEGFIGEMGLLQGMGYRVRTLHGLAHDIVRERPDLVGLDDRFAIVDERDASGILESAAVAWMHENPDQIALWSEENVNLTGDAKIQRAWRDLIMDSASAFIRQCKDMDVPPIEVHRRLEALREPPEMLKMGYAIYEDYERALSYRGAVDFDDLIRLAYKALCMDPEYLTRLRYRWPFILEDEAQDSSSLQEKILRLLSGPDGNWVRVGDPNQAIYETFTTANPQFLRNFLHEEGVIALDLPNSGRSSPGIIALANHLIDWSLSDECPEACRGSLDKPLIEPTHPGDPQPNPPCSPRSIYLSGIRQTPGQELKSVIKSLTQWLPDHPDSTVAILVPRNERGERVVDSLKEAGLPYVELLKSSISTRRIAGLLAAILKCIDEPGSPVKLATVFIAMRQREEDAGGENARAAAENLRRCNNTEDYLWPLPGQDWLGTLPDQGVQQDVIDELIWFRGFVQHWQKASLLPVDQLLLTIAQDLFESPHELALIHKLAVVLENAAQVHPDWHLPQFIEELEVVSRNERRLSGFTSEDTGFNPDDHKGKVVVATIHKAKGLEWDRVYLLSVSNYDFPAGDDYDGYIAEKWFIKDRINLQAEVLERLKALLGDDETGVYVEPGYYTELARAGYIAERLRVLFVGVTRARRELSITWNTGRNESNVAARALDELRDFWEKNGHAAAP